MRKTSACLVAILSITFVRALVRADEPKPAYLLILNFDSPGLEPLGGQLTRSVFDKIRRQNQPQLELVDPLTAADAARDYQLGYESTPGRLAAILHQELAANVALVGALARNGEQFTLQARLLDLRANADDWLWEKRFTASGERARGLLADQLAQAVTGVPVAKPLEAGYDPEPPKLGPTANVNGDFETADPTPSRVPRPKAWQPIDNLTTFWVADPSNQRGRILQINTDVPEAQWLAWRDKLLAGADPADAPKPLPTAPPRYNTVAGNHGVHVFNDMIPAKRGMRYRVLADFKGAAVGFFFPKIFVKGYARFVADDEPTREQDREVWRTYLALRNFDNTWKHYSQTCTPPDNVQRLRVIIYAYWPPGLYQFDNVRLVEEPVAATRPDR